MMKFLQFRIELIDQMIELLNTIIWPFTVVIILILFRRYVANAILRIATLKADKTGVTMTFQNKIEAAKKMLKDINVTSKSSQGINVSKSGSPSTSYQKVLDIRSSLDSKLKEVAESNNVVLNGSNNIAMCDKLMEVGILPYHKAKLINSIFDIINSADSSISNEQAEEIMSLYKGVKL